MKLMGSAIEVLGAIAPEISGRARTRHAHQWLTRMLNNIIISLFDCGTFIKYTRNKLFLHVEIIIAGEDREFSRQ